MPVSACVPEAGSRQRNRGPGNCCCAAPALPGAPTGAAPVSGTAGPAGSVRVALARAPPPLTAQSSLALAMGSGQDRGHPTARQHQRAAAPAQVARQHRGHPILKCFRAAAAAPAHLGLSTGNATPGCNVVPRRPTAGPEHARRGAVRQHQGLRAAPPARQRWGCPRTPQCSRAAAAPAAEGPCGGGTAPAWNVRPKPLTAGPDTDAGPAVRRPHLMALMPLHRHNKVVC
ncbi:uncharacterized protein LOC113490947 [Athene cunicularia]|uniref:uncharacterized protein LOC113490947 n=1 Tax=Athene cunicularia TaxID=194338 RepID=UPI000EF66AFD|nr:uncharacterized protein LOC113490947 [Athene cunicularia]